MSNNMIRVEKNKNNPYVLLNKTALNDANISFRAKGLHSYLLSLPDDWKIYISELTKHSSDGRDAVTSAIDELLLNGYMTREDIRNELGHFKGYDYVVYEIPVEVSEKTKIEYSEKKNTAKLRAERKKLKSNANVNNSNLAENGKPVIGNTEIGKPVTTKYLSLLNIDLQSNNTTTTPEKIVVVEPSFSDEIIQELKSEIDNVIGAKITKKGIKKLLAQSDIETIHHYLNNWSKFDVTSKSTITGFFIEAVKNKYEIPTAGAGQARQYNNKPMADFEQRKYSDDFYKNLYVNFEPKEAEQL